MPHKNYYEVEAKNNFELGYILGELFKKISQRLVYEEACKADWGDKVDEARKYFEYAHKYFPQYIEELRGYAKGAEIPFDELWTRSLEDEFEVGEKCTTFITNGGAILAHNEDEDFGENSAESLCVLKKKIGKLSIFELFYFDTLGGNAVSINSNGYAQAINSLSSTDKQVGIPRNVIGRWFSEMDNPEVYFTKIHFLPRASGFNHVILNMKGIIWNIEATAREAVMERPLLPFAHSNHYLSALKSFEDNQKSNTRKRLETAERLAKKKMNLAEIKKLMENQEYGREESIMNKNTIAKSIFDLKNGIAKIWLKGENAKGFIDYDLSF